MDRYTKIILTIIAINLTISSIQIVSGAVAPKAVAQNIVPVRVIGGNMDVTVLGGRLDYETDTSAGPTLKVCTNC